MMSVLHCSLSRCFIVIDCPIYYEVARAYVYFCVKAEMMGYFKKT